MIAMPFHPSNAFTIDEFNANPEDIIHETEQRAKVSFGDKVEFELMSKLKNGKFQKFDNALRALSYAKTSKEDD